MNMESYYGDMLPRLQALEQSLLTIIDQYPIKETLDGVQPILYCKSRIKSPESMMNKLAKKDLPTDAATALEYTHDAVGVRIVCSFMDDVYEIAKWLDTRTEFEIIERKDYIAYPKPNGYRSLHLILQEPQGLTAEIQIRTIAIDFWAALEHQMKYKRHIEHEKTIQDELKRCADEIASVDVSMQTLRDLLKDDGWA